MDSLSPDKPTDPAAPPASKAELANARLPCRGCLPDCINYPVCNGHPWREDTPAPT